MRLQQVTLAAYLRQPIVCLAGYLLKLGDLLLQKLDMVLKTGFPQEQLVKYYDQYSERGFKLLLDKGGWYGNNHYSHATTYTGVGHATLLSCAHPYKHGVVGNDWIDKKTGKRLYSTEDARFKYLGEETPDHSGTSPFNMKVTTVGDELLYANGRSKVIAISGKDRSAIGLAGQFGTAYMHSTTTGRFSIVPTHRIATWGWLMMGMPNCAPYCPGLVMVKVPP